MPLTAFLSKIKIENLSFAYPGCGDSVFENLNLQLDSDWKLGFIGRNGRGKTTLLRLLLGEGEYPYEGKIIAGLPFDYFPYPVAHGDWLTMEVLHEHCGQAGDWQLLGSLLQALDFFFQAQVLFLLKGIPPGLVLPPGRKAAALDFRPAFVQGQDMIHTAIQKGPVVGNQDLAPFPRQPAGYLPPGFPVQMIGGLINQVETVFPEEEGRQQRLGLLPLGEAVKGPPLGFLRKAQKPKLPQQLPVPGLPAVLLQHLHGQPVPMGHRVREIVKG